MVYIKMAFNDILSQIKGFMLSGLLIMVCLVSIVFIVIMYKGQNYGYNSADEILMNGFESVGFLSLETEEFNDETIQKFYESVRNRKEVCIIGDMCMYGNEPLAELYDIQSNSKRGYFKTEGNYLSVLAMDIGLCDLCNLQVEKGINPDELEFKDEYEYLYLGNSFNDIEVGTEYVGDSGIRYIVAGILNEKQRWINPSMINGVMAESLDWTIDCSNAIFAVKNSYLTTSGIWIGASEGYSVDEAVEAAFQEAEKYQLDFRYTTLHEQYEKSCSDIILVMGYLKDAFKIIIPAIILMLITMQIISMLFELNSYGVLCAVGFSVEEINIILIIKNIIMSFVAFLVAIPIIIWLAGITFDEKLDYIVKSVMINDALPVALFILLVAILVTSITSTITIRRYTPVQLLGKRD